MRAERDEGCWCCRGDGDLCAAVEPAASVYVKAAEGEGERGRERESKA